MTWITNVPSTGYIRFGKTSAYGGVTEKQGTKTVNSWFLSGLSPSTTYHFRVCAKASGSETCSEDQTLTTADAGQEPAAPEAPRKHVDVSMPSGSYGEAFRVDEQCSNLPSILKSIAKLNDELNYEILLAPGTTCRGQFAFPRRPNHQGWIVVRSTGSLPGEGIRVGPGDVQQMATFMTDVLPGARMTLNSFSGCSPGALQWAVNVSGMGLYVCGHQGNSGGAKPIQNASYSGRDSVVITAGGHGYKTGDIVKVAGTNLGIDGLNWRITVLDENSFALDGSRGKNEFSGSGTVTRNDSWGVVPYRAGTELPPECAVNEWFFRTDMNPATEAAHWCTSENTWTRVRAIPTHAGELYAAIQFEDGARRYRFMGLEVTHIPTPNPPPDGWKQRDYRQGQFGSLVASKGSNEYIVFDRCDIHGRDYPSRLAHGFYLNGNNTAVINSRVHKISRWTEKADGVNLESGAIDVLEGGPGIIENNFLEAIGITLFFPDVSRHKTPPEDWVIRRNYFSHPDRYLYGSPANESGKNYMNRNILELKAGVRFLVEGNIFDSNWADINQGAIIMLTPRMTSLVSAKKVIGIDGGVLKVQPATDPYTPEMLVHLTNTGTADCDGIRRIESVLSSSEFRLADAGGCSTSQGSVVSVSSNMQVADVDIRNNVFRYAPNLLWITGHHDTTSSSYLTTKTTQRVRFANNLVYGMDARAPQDGGYVSRIGGSRDGRSGIVVAAFLGMEDLILRNNTIYDFKGKAPTFLFSEPPTRGAHSGLDVRDNIFTADDATISSLSASFPGVEALNRIWTRFPDTGWTFKNNVICCKIRGNKPDNNIWPDRIEDIGFLNPLFVSLQLQQASPLRGNALSGGDIGVDFRQLEEAIGNSLETVLGGVSANREAGFGYKERKTDNSRKARKKLRSRDEI